MLYDSPQTKKRTHVGQQAAQEQGGKTVPHTFVMERGRVGRTLAQLVLDLRRVMEPHTAAKLKVDPLECSLNVCVCVCVCVCV